MLSRDPAAAVQRAILWEYLRTGRTSARLISLGVALVFWPWRSLALAWRLTRRVGRQVAETRSYAVQFVQQIYLAWFHGISPWMYYQLGMVAATRPLRPMVWLQAGHAGLLSRVFRDEKTLPEINDKVLFARLMERHSVPTPPLVAVFNAGECVAGGAGSAFVQQVERLDGLFVKPIRSSGGQDSILWSRQQDGMWNYKISSRPGQGLHHELASYGQQKFSSEKLLEVMMKISCSGGVMVQSHLKNHPMLEEFGGPGLMSLRVLSGQGPTGVLPLRAVLYLPFPDSINSQRGLKSAVDLSNGHLGKVFHSSVDQRFLPSLPGTGTQIEGATLPYWPEILTLVECAHKALPGYPFLGWDLAICPDGPVVLEANGNFATDSLQKPSSRPLIDDQFLTVFNYWQQGTELQSGLVP